ncbi:D-alanyl-D-alanine carboxypeptidase [Clostridium sp. AF32-12BH]|nr:D-alanyl-D-alanine carboxypeptidase family protein [Clostridium sp. AF32-12BH]RHP41665.1 D-alanyl-D-alanine carboxypeptidase [Clostridium sp. AF32-12BH]
MAADAQDHAQADSFAKNLCVVTGEEGEADASVTAEAAAVFGVDTKEVIFQKNPFERLYPASITKIMTALIAIRDGNLDDQVTVGQETVITETGASLAHINPGDTLTLEQLLYGLMLPSGNDAGAAIAVYLSGSTEAFAEKMNETAHALGATDTHFVNPHGLSDEDHYTTAYDLYLIFQEAMKYPEFQKIVGTVSYTASYTDAGGQTKTQEWKNSNQYLNGKSKAPEGITVLGGKTGTTRAAGSCLILGCQDENNRDYISVVLKAESRDVLYENMTNIIGKIVN